jgi:hypothetical protein
MFETHYQPINGYLSTGMAESFTGGKVITVNQLEIGINSPVERITKLNLHTILKFNAITICLLQRMPKYPQFCGCTSVGGNFINH